MLTRRALLALPAALIVAGCAPSSTPSSGTSTTVSVPAGPKIGLITAGSLADSGWNSLAGKGLEDLKSKFNAQTSQQSSDAAQAEQALENFGREGYRIVFAHGSEFGEAAKKVAGRYPQTYWVVSSGDASLTGSNLAYIRFELGEASYLAGMVAAGLSKTGKAGQIGGQDFPPVVQAFQSFEKGGKAVNPKFTSKITYLGNWSDANQAKEQALGMLRDGADIFFQNADAAGEGVFQAVEDKKSAGALAFGSNANQNSLHPEIIVGSALTDVQKMFELVTQDVLDSKFKGGAYVANLKSGGVSLAFNDALKSKISPDLLKKLEQAEQDIKDGKLAVGGK